MLCECVCVCVCVCVFMGVVLALPGEKVFFFQEKAHNSVESNMCLDSSTHAHKCVVRNCKIPRETY